MESEKNNRETPRGSLTDGQPDEKLPDDDFSKSPVRKLPVDCLIPIFSLLPIADRVRIQRVCKHWRDVTLKSWSSCKTLSFDEKAWGYEYWLDGAGGIDLNVLKKVLKLCGPHVTSIDFSKYQHDRNSNSLKSMKANKQLFVLMKHACPKLTAIDIRGLQFTPQGLEYLGKRFSSLTEFAIDDEKYVDASMMEYDGKPLSLFFKNNQNLRRVMLHAPTDGNCLFDLNPIAIEEIKVMHGFGGEENICSALKKFINLRSIGIYYENYYSWSDENEGSMHMNEVLKVIEPHSENLKKLEISSLDSNLEIYSQNFKSFTNLQKLWLEGKGLKFDFITITEYCTKLTCVKLIGLSVTDLQVSRLIQLPELRELHVRSLDKITDAIFINHVSFLKILECCQCSQLTNVGFRKLLWDSSKSLQRLEITECEKVDLRKLIQDTKEAIDNRRTNSLLKLFVK